jgi:hypothetical protein
LQIQQFCIFAQNSMEEVVVTRQDIEALNATAPSVQTSNVVGGGLGAFASVDIAEGSLVALYPGVAIPRAMVHLILQFQR